MSSTSMPTYSSSASVASASAADSAAEGAAYADLPVYDSFDSMGINDLILRGVYSFGFDKPSAIQQKAVVPIMSGRDILAQAQSGTGKTGTFLIGGMHRIDPNLNEVQMVVMSPTRELATQTATVASGIGTHAKIRVHTATGGPPVQEDLQQLQQSPMRPPHIPHILVVTPGRFYDLLQRKAVNPATVRILVMDEADQMLEARFLEQVHCILSLKWPDTCQVALLSATMIPELARIAVSILRDPVKILLPAEQVTLEGIKQWYVDVERDEQKLDTICDLYDNLSVAQATIFVNTRARAEWLGTEMRRRGFDLDYIHGEMDVEERRRRMEAFRKGECRVLISTDLLARGIDVQQVSLVINYELPVQRENYIHRIGRSGRYGRKGASINLINPREMRSQEEIEHFYSTKINPLPMDLQIM